MFYYRVGQPGSYTAPEHRMFLQRDIVQREDIGTMKVFCNDNSEGDPESSHTLELMRERLVEKAGNITGNCLNALPSCIRNNVYTFERDEGTLAVTQSPPAGKKQKVVIGPGYEVLVKTPELKSGEDKVYECKDGLDDENVQFICNTPFGEQTIIDVEGYTKYLVCPDYIARSKKVLLGKVLAWQQTCVDLLEFIKEQDLYSEEAYGPQLCFAESITALVKGVSEFKDVPVQILNKRTIEKVIKGCVTNEHADFLFKMAKCNKFEVLLFPRYYEFENFYLLTRFDECEVEQLPYGKLTLEDLRGEKKKEKNKKSQANKKRERVDEGFSTPPSAKKSNI